jgi:ABC-type sugar transport system substrate-binding protein
MHGKGPVLVLSNPSESSDAKGMLIGLQSQLKAFKIKVSGPFDCGGDEARAKDTLVRVLAKPESKSLQAIFATNADMAYGAAEALKATGGSAPKIMVIGLEKQKTVDELRSGAIYSVQSHPPGGPTAMDLVASLSANRMPPKYATVGSTMVVLRTLNDYLASNPVIPN